MRGEIRRRIRLPSSISAELDHSECAAGRIHTVASFEEIIMWSLFKRNPTQRLQLEYERLLEKARDLQRNGDIIGFAEVTAQAEEIARQIDEQTAKR